MVKGLLQRKLRWKDYPMIVAGGIACFSLLGFLGRWFWVAALVDHFRFHYLVLIAIAVVTAFWWRQWKVMGLLSVLGVGQVSVMEPWAWKHVSIQQPVSKNYSLIWLNVHTSNESMSEVLIHLQNQEFDFICLGEVNAKWLEQLRGLHEKWPHQVLHAREDNFGMAVYSKHPFKRQQILDLDVPCIQFEIENGAGESFTVFMVHPVPPVGARYTAARDLYLRGISDVMGMSQQPLLMVGDFNATPWHYPVKQLMKSHHLAFVSPTFAFPVPTWPAGLLPLGIPIDLLLAQPGVSVNAWKRGPDLGSDHRSLEIRFSLQ